MAPQIAFVMNSEATVPMRDQVMTDLLAVMNLSGSIGIDCTPGIEIESELSQEGFEVYENLSPSREAMHPPGRRFGRRGRREVPTLSKLPARAGLINLILNCLWVDLYLDGELILTSMEFGETVDVYQTKALPSEETLQALLKRHPNTLISTGQPR